jgi:hypothetical protein
VLAAGIGVLAMATPALAVVPTTDCHGVAFTDASNDQYLVTSANTLVRPTVALDIRRVFFADVSTQAILQHNDINGSWVSLSGHATVDAYHGAAGQPGVISFGLPDAADYGPGGFPSTITGMHAEAVQYESNVLTDVSLRQDTATASTSWSQPC